jgi:hypothetical protein
MDHMIFFFVSEVAAYINTYIRYHSGTVPMFQFTVGYGTEYGSVVTDPRWT